MPDFYFWKSNKSRKLRENCVVVDHRDRAVLGPYGLRPIANSEGKFELSSRHFFLFYSCSVWLDVSRCIDPLSNVSCHVPMVPWLRINSKSENIWGLSLSKGGRGFIIILRYSVLHCLSDLSVTWNDKEREEHLFMYSYISITDMQFDYLGKVYRHTC